MIKSYVKEREIERLCKMYNPDKNKDSRIAIPFIQRDVVWETKKQSLLIDSILKSYPIPPIYLFSLKPLKNMNDIAKFYIIDGLQRITTIYNFKNNILVLDLEDNNELNGKTYKDLDESTQEQFDEHLIRTYEISSEEDDDSINETIADLFIRLNTGGTSLSEEDVRLALIALNFSSRDDDSSEEFIDLFKKIINDIKINNYLTGNKSSIHSIIFSTFILSLENGRLDFFKTDLKGSTNKAIKNIIPDITNNHLIKYNENLIRVISFLESKGTTLEDFFMQKGQEKKGQKHTKATQIGIILMSIFMLVFKDKNKDELFDYFSTIEETDIMKDFYSDIKNDLNRLKYSKKVYEALLCKYGILS